jgi:multidrug efflux pump subunit AcrA (membrane-fusion protein)
MTTSSTRRVVTVDLDPSDGELVKRGTTARVELPDGKDVKGSVSSIGTVAQDDSSDSGTGDSSPTIAVTISLPQGSHVTGLDQAPVTVDLTDQVRHDVFVVPVESLLGTAGGGYAIEVRDSAGRRQIPVEPGLFADGYVEVQGQGLHEGMEVEVPGE